MKMESPLVVPKNCAILVPLKEIEADVIEYVKNMKNFPESVDFENKFGHSTDAKVSDILWICSSMLSSCGKQIRMPQIMWFTDEDMPHQAGSSDHQQSFQKAKDLQQLHLEIQFNPMKMDFDGDLFYKELLCLIQELDIDEFEFPSPQLNERILVKRTFRRNYNKRALAHVTVEFSEKAKFGVGIYSFTRKSQVPKALNYSRTNQAQIVGKRTYKYGEVPHDEGDDDANLSNLEAAIDFKNTLEPSMTVKYQMCGNEKIRFTKLEAYEIKQVMDPKIKVLGFKPSSVLNEYRFIKGPYFIYPTEAHVKNSTVFYRALWERCLQDDKVIICIFTMRLKSYPRLVALVPQEQTVGPDGEALRFDGFRMEFIPFAGDVRDLSEHFKPAQPVDPDVAAAMKKVAGRLRINYDATMIKNPVVTRIYSLIEQKQFNEDADEELDKDLTLPDLSGQDDRIGQFVDAISELVGDEDVVQKGKRKTGDDNGAPKQKKPTMDVDKEEVLKLVRADNTKTLTVAILKAFLTNEGVSGLSTLKKSDLIEKVKEFA